MRTRLAAMAENVGIGAAGFFEGVGKVRQAVKGSVIINGLGELGDGAVGQLSQAGSKATGKEGIAEDVTK